MALEEYPPSVQPVAPVVHVRKRRVAIDAAKVYAALTIVILHVTQWQLANGKPPVSVDFVFQMTQWALPLFAAASGYLYGLRLGKTGPRLRWVGKRAVRLGIPYVTWSIVYIVLLTAIAVAKGEPMPDLSPVRVVFTGGAYFALWFLPALFYAQVLGVLATTKRSLVVLASAWTVIALGANAMIGAGVLDVRFATLLTMVIAIYLWGAAIGAGIVSLSPSKFVPVMAISVVALVGVSAAATAFKTTWAGAAVDVAFYVVAWLFLLAASSLTPEAHVPGFVLSWTPYLIGIYVVHAAWLEVFAAAFPGVGLFAWAWIAIALVFVGLGTYLTVWLLSKTSATRAVIT